MTPHAIAHYRVTARIGQGDMGEVYRATNTKLGREVASYLTRSRRIPCAWRASSAKHRCSHRSMAIRDEGR